MPAALIALAAIQTGMSIYQQQQQVRAANRAQRDAQDQAIREQNKLARQQQRRRLEEGTMLGGGVPSMGSRASEQGTILTSTTNTNRSLLG